MLQLPKSIISLSSKNYKKTLLANKIFDDTKIKEKVPVDLFVERIKKIKSGNIECTKHTFFRLSEKQREIYNSGELESILRKETPFLVGIQYNECYAVFYKYKNKILKVILVFTSTKINIVTFFIIKEEQIPRI